MKTDEFQYELPQELIAQTPLAQRDASRLLVYERENGRISHQQFTTILDMLHAGDVLVVNDSRVIPARLFGRKATGGKAEVLLLEEQADHAWKVLVGGKKIGAGTEITLQNDDGTDSEVVGVVTAVLDGPQRIVQFNQSIWDVLYDIGHTPLPPYIHTCLLYTSDAADERVRV